MIYRNVTFLFTCTYVKTVSFLNTGVMFEVHKISYLTSIGSQRIVVFVVMLVVVMMIVFVRFCHAGVICGVSSGGVVVMLVRSRGTM